MSAVDAPSLTQTKFIPLRLRVDLVPRRSLLDLLYTAVNGHVLTLVFAPAGYGKTTLHAERAQRKPANRSVSTARPPLTRLNAR